MNFENWKWINESKIRLGGDEISIYAPAQTDWFRNPVPDAGGELEEPVANAPFFYTNVTGDFIFSAKVEPDHKSIYDAGALMVIENDVLWTKLAFEASDFGTKAAVCVVTNEVSDDANGCDINQENVWLKIVRVGDVFSTHYSLDGENYHMVRLFRLPVQETVKVGLEAQCPSGEGGNRVFSKIKLEHKTVKNLRNGI
ncbi:MAG: DUF1349 domain-containing protein [Hespellia sp.]|nr:DUF1349 domain-containing protein [Hespellia sp.]